MTFPIRTLIILTIYCTDGIARGAEKQPCINPGQFRVQYFKGSHSVLFKGLYNDSIEKPI